MANKRCSQCKILQSISDFHKDKRKKDGNGTAERERDIEVKIPDSKCRCERSKTIIFKKDCIPGCNDACLTCNNPQVQNTPASYDTLTAKEHKDQTLRGTYRSSSAIAVEDGYLEKGDS
jgi:hypothetical protein